MKKHHIIGGLLIGMAVLTDNREARVGLGLLGTAVLFPKQSMAVLDGIAKGLKDANDQFKQSISQPQPKVAQMRVQQIGAIRRFEKWNRSMADRFFKWIY